MTRQEVRCPLCLTEDAAILAYDKRGKPFTRCRACFSTVFIGHPSGLTSILLLGPHIAAILASRGLTVQDAHHEAETILAHERGAA
jgi:hypothetical protein